MCFKSLKFMNITGIILLLLIGFLSGCGGGSSGTGVFATDIDRTRSIKTLTQLEHDELCGRVADLMRDRITSEGFCTFAGLLAASLANNPIIETPSDLSLPNLCAEVKNECEDQFPGKDELEINCALEPINKLSQCTNSLETLESCFNDSFDALEGFFGSLQCSQAGNKEILNTGVAVLATVPASPACEQLRRECPGIFIELNELSSANEQSER